MRTIDAAHITETVERLCMEANYYLNKDIEEALKKQQKMKNQKSADLFFPVLLKMLRLPEMKIWQYVRIQGWL